MPSPEQVLEALFPPITGTHVLLSLFPEPRAELSGNVRGLTFESYVRRLNEINNRARERDAKRAESFFQTARKLEEIGFGDRHGLREGGFYLPTSAFFRVELTEVSKLTRAFGRPNVSGKEVVDAKKGTIRVTLKFANDPNVTVYYDRVYDAIKPKRKRKGQAEAPAAKCKLVKQVSVSYALVCEKGD